MDQFMAELKNYNNHDRLMTNRMDNVLVYKIPDEVWERYQSTAVTVVVHCQLDLYLDIFTSSNWSCSRASTWSVNRLATLTTTSWSTPGQARSAATGPSLRTRCGARQSCRCGTRPTVSVCTPTPSSRSRETMSSGRMTCTSAGSFWREMDIDKREHTILL